MRSPLETPSFKRPRSIVPGRDHRGRLDHQQDRASVRARMVKDATRDRHALVHTKDEWLPPLHLEHEPELVFVLVAVPVDELALDHGKSDDGVIHARERLIHPRLIPRALCGDVDQRKLTVLVVISDVVVLHTHLPAALDWLGETNRRGISSWVSVFGEAGEHVACFPGAHAAAQSIQAGSTKTPSPPSGRSEPMAISSRPSSPASNARTVAGLTRTTSQQRSSRISSSSLTCPEPLMTT